MKSSVDITVSVAPDSKILVRGVNWLGDAVMTTPALMRLREAFPRARLSLLTPPKLKDLWIGHPAVDEAIATQSSLWKTARSLRRHGFDLALILPNSPRTAMEPWLAGIPKRVGCARPWRNWFLTHAVRLDDAQPAMRKKTTAEIQSLLKNGGGARGTYPEGAHQLYHYLNLTACLGASRAPLPPVLSVEEKEIGLACGRFGFGGIGARPVFALNPGAEYGPAKRWPLERFALAAIEVQKRTKCLWLILGGKQDIEIGSAIVERIQKAAGDGLMLPAICLAGKTTLRELCVVLKRAELLLTNDTGPMHLAAALNTPVIVPFGSTSAELTGPGLPGDTRHRLLMGQAPCAPCFLRECPIDFRCMNGITADSVVAAVLEVWQGGNRG